MPYTEVMHKRKAGELHSGSKSGPAVKNQKQAVAIMLSEKRKAKAGKKEYARAKKGTSTMYNFREHVGRPKKKRG